MCSSLHLEGFLEGSREAPRCLQPPCGGWGLASWHHVPVTHSTRVHGCDLPGWSWIRRRADSRASGRQADRRTGHEDSVEAEHGPEGAAGARAHPRVSSVVRTASDLGLEPMLCRD